MYGSVVMSRSNRVSSVRVRAESSQPFQDGLRSIKRKVLAVRRRFEEQRTSNFKNFIASVKQMADDEVSFVKELVDSTVAECKSCAKKPDAVEVSEDEVEVLEKEDQSKN